MTRRPGLRFLICAALAAGCASESAGHDAAAPIDGHVAVDASLALDAAAADDAAVIADDGAVAPDAASAPDAGSCGAHAQSCCAGETCGHAALTCVGGVCQGSCGSAGGPCCAGIVCSELGTTCDAETRACTRPPVIPVYAICSDDDDDGVCAIPSTCLVSLLDTRPSPASVCTVSCAVAPSCPTDPSGRGGACVETGAGPQCYLTCEGTDTCPAGFVCRTAPGDLGDRYVCVPGDHP